MLLFFFFFFDIHHPKTNFKKTLFNRHAKRTYDGLDVAIKEIMRSSFVRDREIYILDKLWHRNIVNLLDIIYLDSPPPSHTHSRSHHHNNPPPPSSSSSSSTSTRYVERHNATTTITTTTTTTYDPIDSLQDSIPLLVLDWAPITLESLLDAFKTPFQISQLKSFSWQLIEGISYLHEHGIVHR